MATNGTRFVLLLSTGVLAVVAAVGYQLLPPRQTDDIAVPANDATPAQVVTAYLEALKAHDCDTAKELTKGAARSSAKSWCESVASLNDIEVDDGPGQHPGPWGAASYDDAIRVPVTFDLAWRLFHNDRSLDEGPTDWGYVLERKSPESPWRIYDHGVG